MFVLGCWCFIFIFLLVFMPSRQDQKSSVRWLTHGALNTSWQQAVSCWCLGFSFPDALRSMELVESLSCLQAIATFKVVDVVFLFADEHLFLSPTYSPYHTIPSHGIAHITFPKWITYITYSTYSACITCSGYITYFFCYITLYKSADSAQSYITLRAITYQYIPTHAHKEIMKLHAITLHTMRYH